jgi:putative copper resistance protein D
VRALYLSSVFLHVVAAMTWVGGMIFFSAVVVPTLRRPETRAAATALVHTFALRFRLIGWIALATLIVTGTINAWFRGVRWTSLLDRSFVESSFGHALVCKLLVVVTVLTMSAVHDFWVGPRALTLAREAPDSPARERFRRTASWMGRSNLLLSLAIVAFAILLAR